MTDRKRHTDSEYASELKSVRENLLKMAGYVEQMIVDSDRALHQMDKALAREVIEMDHSVNRLEVDTDELCLLILAKRQPMASDLRFITLAMKMVTDLERIGDLAVNIAERVLALNGSPSGNISEKMSRMAQITQSMVHDAIDSFVTRNVELAEVIFPRDEEVDVLYRQLSEVLQTSMYEDSEYVEKGIHLKAVAKFLERIGDHANNLAELAIFLVKGKDIRHMGKLSPR